MTRQMTRGFALIALLGLGMNMTYAADPVVKKSD
ncbi:MAG: hypothetical protein RLZ36_2096, partial [Pseudomonadota bacterium]